MTSCRTTSLGLLLATSLLAAGCASVAEPGPPQTMVVQDVPIVVGPAPLVVLPAPVLLGPPGWPPGAWEPPPPPYAWRPYGPGPWWRPGPLWRPMPGRPMPQRPRGAGRH